MAKGIALTIGLNAVDPKHYQGWSGELNACEADAHDMADIAKSKGYKVKTLLTKTATRTRVINEITAAAKALKSGDIFLLSYSGHGGQLPDKNSDENDGQDETWCLYNGELVDDELYTLWGKFAEGVRILVFSDSCHSGTAVKEAFERMLRAARVRSDEGNEKPRYMPREAALRTYRKNKAFYDKILKNKNLKGVDVKASVTLISGCQDNQTSLDGDFNGLFTGTMLQVWNEGNFKKDYKSFHRAIGKLMPHYQTPNYFKVGKANTKFESQIPFTI
jgi:metacaspase-1